VPLCDHLTVMIVATDLCSFSKEFSNLSPAPEHASMDLKHFIAELLHTCIYAWRHEDTDDGYRRRYTYEHMT